jgi:uncharacterized protein YPO0396
MLIDQPLLHIQGATEGTTQWKAETLQVVNWGGFQGHHAVAWARMGTLLSGASGTGKSTLMDAYLALMMPSDTPFNGASTDATGRARGDDQRSVLSYLRGKTDTSRTAGTGDLQDTVLRGADCPTWGAVAMTFVDDNERRFTALRVYFVPRAATRFAEISMKLATKDGFLDLRELESIAVAKFDKRTLKARFPELHVFDTYASFEQHLHTRLGIGANGDGSKALRLLARIQAGQQVRSVDGLYKSMVLEVPATYAAADKATAHFGDLEKSYEAMVTEDQKAKVLEQIPDLRERFDTATENANTLDTFGVNRDGDTPFLLWRLRTECLLLDRASDENRAKQRDATDKFDAAAAQELKLNKRIHEVQDQQRAEGGDALASIQDDLDALDHQREVTLRARDMFDQRVEPLSIPIHSAEALSAAKTTAEHFLKTFDATEKDLEGQRKTIHDAQYPILSSVSGLKKERDSLSGRDGLVPRGLHEVRLKIAEATGVKAEDLPFVAELLDIAPGEERWRKAAEVTLSSVARIMLVDQTKLDHLSRTIDPLRLPVRINFQGVTLEPHQNLRGDPDRISGKLIFKDSSFSSWVQGRVQADYADALCVEQPSELGGGGPRVTVAGQTRNGKRGAHGDMNTPNIIGFSNKARLREITAEIEEADRELGLLAVREAGIGNKIAVLRQHKEAHQYLLDTLWTAIDVAGVDSEIEAKNAARGRILAGSSRLRALKEEEALLTPELKATQKVMVLAEDERDSLDVQYENLVDRKDGVGDEADRISRAQSVTLSEEHSARLDVGFAAVSRTDDLSGFTDGVKRLTDLLLDQFRQAREEARKAAESLVHAFNEFQSRWPDPNLGVALDSYLAYWEILNNILTTGLHRRRHEWRRRLSEWSGEDLVPLNGAFETAITEIIGRLDPVNEILSTLPFGAGRDRLRIHLRRHPTEDVSTLRAELKALSSGTTENLTDEQTETHFARLRDFMNSIRKPEDGAKGTAVRDNLLDVRKHVEITAIRTDLEGTELSSYSSLGGKSGGETQELIAFIVGAALRFQLGDDSLTRPRFAPVFLDEGFVKSDSEFAGRSVAAWQGLGFQLIVGAPLDKVTALEPHMDLVLSMTKDPKTGYSYITELATRDGAGS